MSKALSFFLVGLQVACASTQQPEAHTSSSTPRSHTNDAAWSETNLSQNIQARLAAKLPNSTIAESEALVFSVATAEGQTLSVRFTKAADECRLDWNNCEAAVEHVVNAAASSLTHAPIQSSQLRIALRSQAKIENARKIAPDLTARTFLANTHWMLVADYPDRIRLDVSGKDIGAVSEAWALALTQTRPQNPVTEVASDFIIFQDAYAPSALLFPEVLEAALKKHLPTKKGKLLAATPEENILLFTFGGSAEAKALRELALANQDSQQALSSTVVEWNGKAWVAAR